MILMLALSLETLLEWVLKDGWAGAPTRCRPFTFCLRVPLEEATELEWRSSPWEKLCPDCLQIPGSRRQPGGNWGESGPPAAQACVCRAGISRTKLRLTIIDPNAGSFQ